MLFLNFNNSQKNQTLIQRNPKVFRKSYEINPDNVLYPRLLALLGDGSLDVGLLVLGPALVEGLAQDVQLEASHVGVRVIVMVCKASGLSGPFYLSEGGEDILQPSDTPRTCTSLPDLQTGTQQTSLSISRYNHFQARPNLPEVVHIF